jgi:hypothetical protein
MLVDGHFRVGEQLIAFVGREAAPDSEPLSMADRVLQALPYDSALRADLLGFPLAP